MDGVKEGHVNRYPCIGELWRRNKDWAVLLALIVQLQRFRDGILYFIDTHCTIQTNFDY